jgi:AcrR family transcriptional regulator
MPTAERTLRADAARNRQALLDAADQLTAERGFDVAVADITVRAGVGKGTFFRHFASKDDLFAALVANQVNGLDGIGRGLLDASDSGDALLAFMAAASERRQEHQVEFLMRAGDGNARLREQRGRLFTTIEALVERAQADGKVRLDVTAVDVAALMCAPSHAVALLGNAGPDLWRRYLDLIFDGLRPDGAHPLHHAR